MSESFATTRWTLVLAAHAPGLDEAAARRALGELCAQYRAPLLTHARRRGLAEADAEDAVQGFFARLLAGAGLGGARRERGRFRAFLLGAFNHHLADLRDRERAAKRGGGRLVQLDTRGWARAVGGGGGAGEAGGAGESGEMAFRRGDAGGGGDALAPDAAFDRAWAVALLGAVMERLRAEQAAAGRAEWFEALAPCLAGRTDEAPQAAVAARLGVSEPALRVAAVHRLRKRFRELLRAEVAETVANAGDPAEVEAEMRHLLRAVSG